MVTGKVTSALKVAGKWDSGSSLMPLFDEQTLRILQIEIFLFIRTETRGCI